MNIFEQNRFLLSLCPIPESIQEMIFIILVGYGTPNRNILENLELIKYNFMKKINVTSFGKVGYLKICHTRKLLNYYEILTMYNNAKYFTLETLYELHMIYLQKSFDMTYYVVLKLHNIKEELHNNIKKRILEMIEEEKT